MAGKESASKEIASKEIAGINFFSKVTMVVKCHRTYLLTY